MTTMVLCLCRYNVFNMTLTFFVLISDVPYQGNNTIYKYFSTLITDSIKWKNNLMPLQNPTPFE